MAMVKTFLTLFFAPKLTVSCNTKRRPSRTWHGSRKSERRTKDTENRIVIIVTKAYLESRVRNVRLAGNLLG